MQSPKPSELIDEDQYQFLMSDPLTYYVVQHVTVGENIALSKLREELSFRPEVAPRLDEILRQMARKGIIRIEGDRIELLKRGIRYKLSKSSEGGLLPSLFEIAARRGVQRLDQGFNDIVSFCVSESPETAQEIHALVQEFRQKMREIGARVDERQSTGIRFVGLINTPVLGNDFAPEVKQGETREAEASVDERHRQMTLAAHDIRPAIAALRALRERLGGQVDAESRLLMEPVLERLEGLAHQFLPSQDRSRGLVRAELVRVIDRVACEKRVLWGDRAKLSIHFGSESALPVNLPEQDLERAVSNLLDNSFEALGAETTRRLIEVELACREGDAELRIEDTGEGMEPEVLQRLSRGEALTTKVRGNGLGFRSAVRTVEAAGGKFELHSVRGQGTRVRISLPIARA